MNINLNIENGVEWILNDESAILYVVRNAFLNPDFLFKQIYNEADWKREIVYMAGKR